MSIQKAARELNEKGTFEMPIGTLRKSRMIASQGKDKGKFRMKLVFKSSRRLLNELKKMEANRNQI